MKNESPISNPSYTPSRVTSDIALSGSHETTQEVTRTVPFIMLTPSLKGSFEQALESLKKLKSEAEEKIVAVRGKISILTDHYQELKKNKHITFHMNFEEIFSKSLKDYEMVTAILLQEIHYYMSTYEPYVKPTPPAEISIPFNESRSVEHYLAAIIKLLQSYAKNRKKELSIVFSRYDHGFNNQVHRFESLQRAAHSMDRTQVAATQ